MLLTTENPAQEEHLAGLRLNDQLGDATLISMLAYAGVRPGEALALEWRNVLTRALVIESAASLGEVKEPKTRRLRSVRVLAPLLDHAAAIDAGELRSLDAIHIASAQQLQAELDALVSYDERMLMAAQALGVPVSRP